MLAHYRLPLTWFDTSGMVTGFKVMQTTAKTLQSALGTSPAKDILPRKISPQVIWLAVILGFIGVFGITLSVLAGPQFLIATLAAGIGVSIFAYPKVGLGLLVPALFLEADIFDFDLPFGRFRTYHFLIAILFARLLWDLLRQKITWRKTALDWPLGLYLGINAVALYFAPDRGIALKILGLLVSLSMLYWVITNFVRTREAFHRLVRILLNSSVIVALIGLAQVGIEWLNQKFDLALWHGPVMHSDILPYGRPYGTFVEPDWFGAFILVALLVAAALFLSRTYRLRQVKTLLLVLLFTVVTVLAAVRGAWLGLLIGIAALFVIDRVRRRDFNWGIALPAVIGLGVAIIITALVVPDVLASLMDRIGSLFRWSAIAADPRFVTMQSGWDIWLQSPWIGFGPGAFKTLGVVPFQSDLQALILGYEAFQTNAFLTVLIDTGLIGLSVTLLVAVQFVRTVGRGLRHASAIEYPVLVGLVAAALGLFVSYQVTAGLWLGLPWFLMAVIVAGANLVAPERAPVTTRADLIAAKVGEGSPS